VSVRVHVSDGALDIEVVNEVVEPAADEGSGRGAAPGRVGRGLAGMRERVTTLGGRVSAVGAEDGRWRVSVRLPTGAETQA
jgi:signal transduction histidine kinase